MVIYIYMLIIANFKIFQLSKWHFDAFWGYIPNKKKTTWRPSLAAVLHLLLVGALHQGQGRNAWTTCPILEINILDTHGIF